jgi:hypothetical protein
MTNEEIARLKSHAKEHGVVVEIYNDYQAASQVQAVGGQPLVFIPQK